MPTVPALLTAALALALGATGCLTDEPTELGEATSPSEVVVTAPTMYIICTDCFLRHIVGDPVTIRTSFHGECRSTPAPWTYPCNPQPYTLTIECLDAACTQAPAGGDGFSRFTEVTPLEPGPMTLRVRMNERVFTLPTVTSFVPDELRVTCTTGLGYDQPCRPDANEPRVQLTFALFTAGEPVYPTGRFELESDRPGLQGGNAGDHWYLSAPGDHHVTARYGDLSREVTVNVAPGPESVHAGDAPADEAAAVQP